MASLGRLTIDMVANLAGFEKDMGRAQRVTAKSMQSVRRDLRRAERDADKAAASIKRLGMQFAALAGVSLGLVVREFNQLAQQADRLDKLSQGTGATVEALQRLGFAAEQSGTTMEVLAKGLQTMQRNLQGARDGLTTYQRSLDRIGVSTDELFQLDAEGQFLLIADALSKLENATARSATAQEIFGRAGKELLAFFDAGTQSAIEWGEALERSGALISGPMAADFARFNDNLNLLSRQFTALKVQIFGDLIEPMADFVEFLNTEEGTRRLRETLDDLAATAKVVGAIIGVRMVGQLSAASIALGVASVKAAQASIALAGMSKTATVASGAFRGLGIAARGMMGPLGLAAIAFSTFAIASDDATDSLLGYEDAMRDARFETKNFANQQQIASDIFSFTDQATEARRRINQLRASLEALSEDKHVTESLVEYRLRMKMAEERTEAVNAEIARLQTVIEEAGRKIRQLNAEYRNFQTETEKAEEAAKELADQLEAAEREEFLLWMQDLSDELEGGSAPAMRAFAREVERLQDLMARGRITAEQYVNAVTGLAQLLRRETEGEDDPFNLADTIIESIQEGFSRIDAQTLLSGGFGDAMRVVGMTAFEGIGSKLGQEFGDELGTKIGDNLGKQLGGVLGDQLGSTIGNAVGSAMGAAFPVIGQIVGSLIGDLLFGEKDPKFQVGGTTGFFGTGGAVKGQFETAFGTQLFRFRNLEDEVKAQIQQALVNFDNTIASIITDQDQFGAIANALKNFGYDSQDEAASIQELLQQRFDAVLGSFDQFTQDMVRQAYGLEAQVQRLAEFLEIQRMATFTGDMGFANQEDFLYQVTAMQRGTETLVDTFNRFVTTMNLLEKVSDLTGVQIRDSHGALIAFGDELLQVFGDDMQRFQASLNRIFETFFDADEILEQTASASRERAAALLSQIGIDLTDELLTVEGFRELFDNLLPQLSAEQVAILIEAGVAVADFVDATNELNGSVGDASDSVEDMSMVLSERAGLERRLAQLTGDTAALRQMELDALDESNRHLLERIFALEDEAAAQRELEKIANERDSLLQRELRLLGDTEEIRRLELEAVDESNREILKRIFALEDEAAAAAEATAIANERAGLERRLYTLLGDTAALRQMELDSLDPANRELLERIFAIEDERAANEAAARSAEEAARAQEQYRQELNKLIDDFTESMQGVEETILLAPLNDFQREMVEINRQTLRTAAAINAAAGSAITQEQAERALARAHQAAAIQVQAAVAKLEASTVRLVQEVFGTPLDEINRQISLLEQNTNSASDAINNAANAMKELADFADSLLLGNLSPLSSREQLTLGLSELRAASQAGDVSAVQSLARQVLEIGRERFASGPEFAQLFADVQDIIKSTVPAEDEPQPVEVVESPALAALYAERDRMLKEQAEADRRANAVDIAQAVADIAGATGASFETIAKNLGVPLDELARILGLDYDQIDEFLAGLQTDTMTLARKLELFAEMIKQDLHDMAGHIIAQLQEPIQLEVTVISELVDKVVIGDDQKKPPKVPVTPPILMGDDGLANQGKQSGKSYGDQYDKGIERNTAETVQEIRRLADVLERSSTRSTRTALA